MEAPATLNGPIDAQSLSLAEKKAAAFDLMRRRDRITEQLAMLLELIERDEAAAQTPPEEGV